MAKKIQPGKPAKRAQKAEKWFLIIRSEWDRHGPDLAALTHSVKTLSHIKEDWNWIEEDAPEDKEAEKREVVLYWCNLARNGEALRCELDGYETLIVCTGFACLDLKELKEMPIRTKFVVE